MDTFLIKARNVVLSLGLLFCFSSSLSAGITTGVPGLIGSLKGANLNVTTDQAIDVQLGGTKYYITRILITNATTTPTSAVGGFYTASSKGGSAIVASSQAYSSLSTVSKVLSATLAITDTSFSVSTIYLSLTTGAGVACTADIYIYGELLPVLAGEITITAPVRYQTKQRASGVADIPIAGTIRGEGGTWIIEARFKGGDWSTVATASAGSFSGTLSSQPQGQGLLEMRATQGSTISNLRSVADVGIGDVFLIAGQSNGRGRAITPQVWSHTTLKASEFKGNYTWGLLVDPIGTGAWTDSVSDDFFATGSVWPRVAEKLMTDKNVPVAFINAAMGNTGILQWLPGSNHQDRTTLYGAAVYRQLQVGACAAVLWWQGESDSGPPLGTAMSRATYNGHLDTIANAFAADVGCKLMPAKLQNNTGLGAPEQAQIRLAVGDAWADNVNVLTGPDLSSLTTDDAYHIRTTSNLQSASNLWSPAIEAVTE
jgi:hypothetical protein